MTKKTKLILMLVLLCHIYVSPIVYSNPTEIIINKQHKALLYQPKSLNTSASSPLIIALHGMGESTQSVYRAWKPVADQLGSLLLCPKGSNYKMGYTRKPIDDRKIFIQFRDYMTTNYDINEREVILAGFSRGGNFAIETGLLYPHQFPNIICIFGFYNTFNDTYLDQFADLPVYKKSHFLLLTSKNDMTEKSLTYGYHQLNSISIQAQLKKLPNIHHAYPDNLTTIAKNYVNWIKNK